MMAITLPVHLTPVEIFRSLFKGSMLCRKTGIKSSALKSDSQLPGYLTAFARLLILSVLQRMLAVACLAICVLPAISDWQGNYLVRAAGDWTMPIIGWLDFKIALFETYNNKPPPDIDRNSFTTTAGLSFRF